MQTSEARKVKKGKLKMLLFFLFIAFFIWFLTKFSKDFTASVNASIVYKNLPDKTVVSNTNVRNLSCDLTTNGFDFLFYKIKKPEIDIDVAKYYRIGDLSVNISTSELLKIISFQLKNNNTVKNLSITDMTVVLDTIGAKKIPILLVSDIVYQNGYKSVDILQLKPDSIIVSGPSMAIDTISQIKTKLFKLHDVKNTISEEIEIDTFDASNITYSQRKVILDAVVEEFTQKKITLPIKVINLPNDINIKLISEVITITFDVSLSKFNSIGVMDFEAICDYNNRNNEENFMIPELITKPERILNIEFQEKKIDYLIFK